MTSPDIGMLQNAMVGSVQNSFMSIVGERFPQRQPPINVTMDRAEEPTTTTPHQNTTKLLKDAYDKQSLKQKRDHDERMKPKLRGPKASSGPGSSVQTPRKRQSPKQADLP